MYKNLRDYISRLEQSGELIYIDAAVDPVEEIAEITDRMSKTEGGGKALFFRNTGTGFPVVTNLFGSDRRMAMALGADSIDDIPARIDMLANMVLSPKKGLADKIKLLPLLGRASAWLPKNKRGRGECQQVVLRGEEARLNLLPILKCWEHDGGRFVTLPLVNTMDPETGTRNLGMYRMQVFDNHTTGMHWHMHKTGAKHYEGYKKRGERMPVSVCIGGDPAYTYSAVAPLPEGLDEYLLAGFLRNRPVKLVKCLTNDLRVPSDCDFVIEGYVDPAEEKVIEGPFGDHTGFYSLEDYYPKFHVTAITHRRDAVYPATIVGVPPQEDAYIGKATERIFLSPIRLVMNPEIQDLYMPEAGVAHNLAIVNMRKDYPGQAHKLASSLWGAGQMMFEKYIVMTSTDKDIRDKDVLARLVRGADMERDVIFSSGVLDVLDHATATNGFGGKMALDLTGVSELDGYLQPVLPDNVIEAGGIASLDSSFVDKWGVVVLRAQPDAEVSIKEFVERNGIRNIKCAVLFDSATEGFSPDDLLWLATGNTDPRRDVVLVDGALLVDARTKLMNYKGAPKRFPNVVASSRQIVSLVDARWEDYGLGERIASPSAKYRKLVRSEKAEV